MHSTIEVGGKEVPEDLGPEKAFEGGGDLICSREKINVVLSLFGARIHGGNGIGCRREGVGGTMQERREGDRLHIAAVRMISRAQWFLMSLPMMCIQENSSVAKTLDPAEKN